MARSSHQKLKILYMLRLFMEKTDDQHPVTVTDIMDYLSGYDITVERKTIYDDIETLRIFGLDIINRRSRPSGFYLGSREFELAELKLLVDAVQSSKFITGKKSTQLIHKIESLTSKYEAKQLHRQVFVEHRVKSMNESVYYNIDEIHQAIDSNTQISFQYYEWTILKEMRLRKNGERYRISPWGLIWKDENYYLLGLDEKSKIVKHYRVDKMLKIQQESEKRNGQEIFEDFDAAIFATRTFGMFGGKEEVVTMSFRNHLVGVVIDRFGQDIMIRRQDEEHFLVSVKVNISSQFFAWISGLGTEVKIEKPISIRNEYQEYLAKILSNYTNTKEENC